VPFETSKCELSNSSHRCAVWNHQLCTLNQQPQMCRLKPATVNCQTAATDVPFETSISALLISSHRCAVWNQKLWTVKQQPQMLNAPFCSRFPIVELRSVNYVVKQDGTHTHTQYCFYLSVTFCHSVQETPNTSPLLNITGCWTQSTCSTVTTNNFVTFSFPIHNALNFHNISYLCRTVKSCSHSVYWSNFPKPYTP